MPVDDGVSGVGSVPAVGPPTAPRTPAGSVRGGGQNQVLGGRHVHDGANLVPVGGGQHAHVRVAYEVGYFLEVDTCIDE